MNIETLVTKGPSNEHVPLPEDLRLKNGDPLYYLLLPPKDVAAGIIDPSDSQQAHDRLRSLFALDMQKVLSCAGKSAEEAKEILNSIESH
ncbi:hypothetical protein H0X32_02885 [Patescibacteria group bacterium]|nr:hypothetical protein [Patescibacteria group bacterium]